MIVTGTLKDKDTGALIPGSVYIANKDGSNISDITSIPDGYFTIDITNADSSIYYFFSANGYNLYYANAPFLLAIPGSISITLQKENSIASNSVLPIAAGLGLLLLTSKKNKKVGAITKENAMPLVYVGGAIVGYIVLRKLLIELHLIDSPETKVLDAASNDPTSFWNPNYYKQFTTFTYSINRAEAEQLVRQIEDSFGPVNDCEECAIAVFHTLKTKASVSYLSDVFYQQTSNDLLTYLRGGSWPEDRLSDTDVAGLQSFINNLPTH